MCILLSLERLLENCESFIDTYFVMIDFIKQFFLDLRLQQCLKHVTKRAGNATRSLTMATFCPSFISDFEIPFLRIWNYLINKISHENHPIDVIQKSYLLRQKFQNFKIPSIVDEENQLLDPSVRYFLNKAMNSVWVPTQKTRGWHWAFSLRKWPSTGEQDPEKNADSKV